MAQYDILFTRNDHASGLEFAEHVILKPIGIGYFLTQEPSTGDLSWSKTLETPVINGTVSGTAIVTNLSTNPAAGKLLDALTAKQYMDGIIAGNDAMVFKGTVSVEAGILKVSQGSPLGVNFNAIANYNAGWTYKVKTAVTAAQNPLGNYALEIGDMIIAVQSSATWNLTHWTVIQTNIDAPLFDGLFTGTGLLKRTGTNTYTVITDNSTNWNTAFGWGNHATPGYALNTNLTAHINDNTKHVPYNGVNDNKRVLTATATPGVFNWSFVQWEDIGNKPTTFPVEGHTHTIADITGLQTALDGKLGINANAVSASKLLTARSIAASGDATWSVNFDGSANVSAALTLSNSGVTAGTYGKVTVDAKGRVTVGAALAAGDIPNLDAAKITSGIFNVDRIPNLAISKITGLQTALDLKLQWNAAPAAHNTSGVAGSVAYNASYIYVCVATNTWRRAALAKW